MIEILLLFMNKADAPRISQVINKAVMEITVKKSQLKGETDEKPQESTD